MIETTEIEKILDNYDLIEKKPINFLRESADNFVFVIGRVNKSILRISKRLPINDVIFEMELLKHLDSKGVPVSRVIKNKDGLPYSLIDASVCVIFEFMDGVHIKIDKDHLPTKIQAFNAGKNLGLFAEAAKDFIPTSERRRDVFMELNRVLSHEEYFTKNFEGGPEFISQVKEALKFGMSKKGKMSVIHNDYRPSNVFFNSADSVVGLIDFDWACVGPSIKDLALAIVEWSFPDGSDNPDMNIFDEFLSGYNSVVSNKIQKDENLFRWITFTTLSDSATYFCDLVEDRNSTKRVIRSFMYRKYFYFKKNN